MVTVIIPCYNEETTIEDVITDYQKYFDDILVVDNNCTDNTAKIAEKCGATVIQCNIQGKGAALRTAFNYLDSDYVVLTDGDSTYSAKDSYRLFNYTRYNRLDMTVGNRLASNYFKHNQIIHGFGNRLFSKIASIKYKHKVVDLLSGSRVLSKDFYKSLKLTKNGFEVETEITKQCKRYEFLNISYNKRPTKSKLHTFKDGFKILKEI